VAGGPLSGSGAEVAHDTQRYTTQQMSGVQTVSWVGERRTMTEAVSNALPLWCSTKLMARSKGPPRLARITISTPSSAVHTPAT
jgi:hypothetical protein